MVFLTQLCFDLKRWFIVVGLCWAGLLAQGCAPRPANATPEGAVRDFIERMRVVGTDSAAPKAAFASLSKRAQQNLAERAQRYSAASGKTIAPEAMIVPSRFLIRFEPQRMTATVVGSRALVEVIGLAPEERANVPCAYENDGWRIDLELPPLPAVQVRPGSTP
ncbi:MAG TPA: hypothetical protein PK156_43755 [Polyangium sp.]|nr:hypothetical protein [Polyangium sp.]